MKIKKYLLMRLKQNILKSTETVSKEVLSLTNFKWNNVLNSNVNLTKFWTPSTSFC